MIFILTAMPAEARELIVELGLRRVPEETRYQIFEDGAIRLIITGVGQTKAMMATTYLLTRYQAKNEDFLLNLGISGVVESDISFKQIHGGIFQARSIHNMLFQRTFYPDLIIRTPFAEADLSTDRKVYKKSGSNQEPLYFDETVNDVPRDISSNVACKARCDGSVDIFNDVTDNTLKLQTMEQNDLECNSKKALYQSLQSDSRGAVPQLVDMEAAFIHEAASFFIYTHHLFFLKIISDDGVETCMTKAAVQNLMSVHTKAIAEFILSLEEQTPEEQNPIQTLTDRIKTNLRLTKYQQDELDRLVRCYKIRHSNAESVLSAFEIQEVKTKREGSVQYGRIREILLEP